MRIRRGPWDRVIYLDIDHDEDEVARVLREEYREDIEAYEVAYGWPDIGTLIDTA